MSDDGLLTALDAAAAGLRLRLLLRALGPVDRVHTAQQWLDDMIDEAHLLEVAAYEITIATLHPRTLHVAVDTGAGGSVDPLITQMETGPFNHTEISLAREFAAPNGGWWLSIGSVNDAGWYRTAPIPFSGLDGLLPDSPATPVLLDWWREHSIAGPTRIERSPSGPRTRLYTELPGDDALERVAAGLDVHDAFGIGEPGDDALSAMLQADRQPGIVIMLGPDGVHELGFSAVEPGSRSMLQAVHSLDVSNTERLSQAAGIAGGDPARVDVITTADGFDVRTTLRIEIAGAADLAETT